jgi:hypothetical protein
MVAGDLVNIFLAAHMGVHRAMPDRGRFAAAIPLLDICFSFLYNRTHRSAK